MTTEVRRNMPLNLKKEHADFFEQSALFSTEELRVAKIKRAFVFSNGIVWRWKLFVPSLAALEFRSRYTQAFLISCIIKSALKNRLVFAEKKHCIVAHDELGFNYYHWLTGSLTRLYLLRYDVRDCILILPDSYRQSFHLYTLKKFGIKNVQWVDEKSICVVDSLYFPFHTAPASEFNPDVLKSAVRFLISGLEYSRGYSTKVYIVRRNNSARKVLNEEAVKELMLERGFEIYYPEEKDFEEQVRFFSAASVIVSIHGAGLTNMMFMQQGSFVLEFRNSKNTSAANNCYFNLANAFEHNYLYLACEPDSALKEQDANIYVDITQLRNSLDLIPHA